MGEKGLRWQAVYFQRVLENFKKETKTTDNVSSNHQILQRVDIIDTIRE